MDIATASLAFQLGRTVTRPGGPLLIGSGVAADATGLNPAHVYSLDGDARSVNPDGTLGAPWVCSDADLTATDWAFVN